MYYKKCKFEGIEWRHKVYSAEDLFDRHHFNTHSYWRLVRGTEKYTRKPINHYTSCRGWRKIFVSAMELILADIIENGDVFVPFKGSYELKVAKTDPWRRAGLRGTHFEHGFKDIQVTLAFPFNFQPKAIGGYLVRANLKSFRLLWDKIKSGFKYEY